MGFGVLGLLMSPPAPARSISALDEGQVCGLYYVTSIQGCMGFGVLGLLVYELGLRRQLDAQQAGGGG
jgi:hypothetical protein